MNVISPSWSCQRCGAAFTGNPPDHGLCEECLSALEEQMHGPSCPVCGGPVCIECGQRMVLAVPVPWPLTAHRAGAAAGEVSGDGG